MTLTLPTELRSGAVQAPAVAGDAAQNRPCEAGPVRDARGWRGGWADVHLDLQPATA